MGIYDHTDYRTYLREFYEEHKSLNPRFSYQAFARWAGFKGKSAVHRIMLGKRDISKHAVYSIGKAMRLDEKAFLYFQHMVAYAHAKDPAEKRFYLHALLGSNPRMSMHEVDEDAYEFFSQWFCSTLRELLPLLPFKDDFASLGKLLNPPITADQAKYAVQLLLRLGLVEKTRTGYCQKDRAIASGSEAKGLALRDFHEQNMDLAKRAVRSFSSQERDFSCLVVAVPDSGLDLLKQEIRACREKIARLADEMEGASRVYHVNFQVFPTAAWNPKKKSP